MAFIYRCPFCTATHQGELPEVGRKVQCKQCEYSFTIAPPSAADMIRVNAPPPRDTKTPMLWAVAAGFVVLLAGGLFAAYEFRYGWESKHRKEVVQLSAEAEEAMARGDEKGAYVKFAAVAQIGKGRTHLSNDLKALIDRATTENAELENYFGPVSALATATTKPATRVALTRKATPPAPAETTAATIAPAPLGANLTAEQIVSRYSRSVVLIKSPVGSGTGFVVGPRMVLTNYHVISLSPTPQLKIYFPASDNRSAATPVSGLLFADARRDLAILSVDTAEKPLTAAENYAFKAGQSVVVIGNPGMGPELILENAVSAGIMSTRLAVDGHDYFQMSISINPGNSGGPVFDNTGAVVGVATLKAKSQEGIAFAVPAEDVLKAIAEAKRATPAEMAQGTADHNLVAVCRRVSMMSGVYVRVMELYVAAMRDAEPTPAKGLANAKMQVQAKLNKANAEAMTDIDAMVQALLADKKLPQATRDKISEEWAMYLDAKNNADNPRVPAATYENTLARLMERRKKAVTALQKALGVDDLLADE